MVPVVYLRRNMKQEQVQRGVCQLLWRLDPSLDRSREPSFAEAERILKEHGLWNKSFAELARMGYLPRRVLSLLLSLVAGQGSSGLRPNLV